MTKEVQSKETARRIERGISRMERDMPSLKSILDPFREILVARAILKESIVNPAKVRVPAPNPERFAEGRPLLTPRTISSLMYPWGDTVDQTIPPLARAFPSIEPELMRLREALQKGDVDLKKCVGALVGGKDKKLDAVASDVGIQPVVLKFLLGQMLKPFVEKRAESLKPLIQNLPWHKGYCPICGAFPELSFLTEKEGQRWLRCSLCAYEWRFSRATCPFCHNEDPKTMEMNFVKGREYEWAELCHQCHRYIVNIDLRESPGSVTTEVAALGMVYLDILAQGKGYLPMAVCAWNVVSEKD